MPSAKRPLYWKICCAAAIGLSILTFTPWVIGPDKVHPYLFGMPRTLWAGILITIAFVVLTAIGANVHPGKPNKRDL